jgi:hypothetical protein
MSSSAELRDHDGREPWAGAAITYVGLLSLDLAVLIVLLGGSWSDKVSALTQIIGFYSLAVAAVAATRLDAWRDVAGDMTSPNLRRFIAGNLWLPLITISAHMLAARNELARLRGDTSILVIHIEGEDPSDGPREPEGSSLLAVAALSMWVVFGTLIVVPFAYPAYVLAAAFVAGLGRAGVPVDRSIGLTFGDMIGANLPVVRSAAVAVGAGLVTLLLNLGGML